MKNKKTIINDIATKVIQYLEQKYDLIRFDGNMKMYLSKTCKLIEKSTVDLLEDDSNIFDDENAVDLFAKVIAEKLALAYWDTFQR